MADPNIYPTYFDTYSRTKNRPFMKRKKGDVMNIGPDMSATPGYVDPSLPLTKKYVTGPLNQTSFVTAPTKEQKDAGKIESTEQKIKRGGGFNKGGLMQKKNKKKKKKK